MVDGPGRAPPVVDGSRRCHTWKDADSKPRPPFVRFLLSRAAHEGEACKWCGIHWSEMTPARAHPAFLSPLLLCSFPRRPWPSTPTAASALVCSASSPTLLPGGVVEYFLFGITNQPNSM